jgi:hypothetical protein
MVVELHQITHGDEVGDLLDARRETDAFEVAAAGLGHVGEADQLFELGAADVGDAGAFEDDAGGDFLHSPREGSRKLGKRQRVDCPGHFDDLRATGSIHFELQVLHVRCPSHGNSMGCALFWTECIHVAESCPGTILAPGWNDSVRAAVGLGRTTVTPHSGGFYLPGAAVCAEEDNRPPRTTLIGDVTRKGR